MKRAYRGGSIIFKIDTNVIDPDEVHKVANNRQGRKLRSALLKLGYKRVEFFDIGPDGIKTDLSNEPPSSA